MLSQVSSMLVALLLIIAGATLLVMIEMTGQREKGQQERKKKIPRVLAYLFFFLFALVVVFVLNKDGGFNYQGMMAGWEPVHIVLALLVVTFILIKLLLIKLQVQKGFWLLFIGRILFAFIFTLIGVTIGYCLFNSSEARSVAGLQQLLWNPLRVTTGQGGMAKKCSKCHSLERVFLADKNENDWRETVQRMADLDYPNISQGDVEQITSYLIVNQQQRGKKRDHRKNGKNLIARKCVICHDLERVFRAKKTTQEWTKTIDTMVGFLGVSNFLSLQEKNDIIIFLSTRQSSTMKATSISGEEKIARALVARKCSAGCHALDRVLRVQKTPQQWMETVESMEAMSGDPDFLSESEEKMIVEWLLQQKHSSSQEAEAGLDSPEAMHALVSNKCKACHNMP
ncbi:MAG: hypothetical protein Q3M24_02160 [Candidatus Electrothrix aestuarii]|uniref:Cytochrome c domain-containing protein n=1 Tax=Candidatus Electrothrix aestuarii TaxID=3062594 RepID=A0AAU8LWJ3_9BACT|nr:hypothetical protein [Candidatus Electrothrix aestuarii]